MHQDSLASALQSAVKSLSKKQQISIITSQLYSKYKVFSEFKPLAIGIDEVLVKLLPDYNSALIIRALSNHCKRPKYLKQLSKGGRRYTIFGRPEGYVSNEEKEAAKLQFEQYVKQRNERVAQKKQSSTVKESSPNK